MTEVTVYPHLMIKIIPTLSRDPTPVGSLPTFVPGITPYLPHYKATFAFSDIFYPLIYRLTLRLAFHTQMETIGLTLIPLILHSGLASVYPPGES